MADAVKMDTKRKHHELTLKVNYEALKELEKGRPNKDVANQLILLVVLLLLGRKANKKSLKLFKVYHRNEKSENWNIQKVKWSLAEVVYINVW